MAAELDRDQLKAVRAEKNTVVTAGAGSGKTTVLAHRFVHLIRSGKARVDGILTLTFTRKAAAEMYERIYRLLLQEAKTADLPEERAALREALKEFEKASISTLDSFCAGIIRGGSSRFGVPGDFQQDEYASGIFIREAALQFLLEKGSDPAMGAFLLEHGVEDVLELLLIPIASEEFHLAERHDFKGLFEGQLDHLRSRTGEIATVLGEVRRWFLEEDLSSEKKSLMSVREALQGSADPVEAAESGDWEALRQILSTSLRSPGNVKDPRLVEAKNLIKSWKEGTSLLEPILELFLNEELYRGMYHLLDEYQSRIAGVKRSNGILTFRDVVEMAVSLLREETGLRAFYKKKFTHIMIDEFQDNNDLQRQLLFLLAEKEELNSPGIPEPWQLKPDKLFFVGDEKQSIYRFRGADVRVLKQLQGQIRDSGGESLQLPRNYRSHSELIGFFNRLFSRVMADGPAGRGGNVGDDFEAEFVPLEAPVVHGGFIPDIRLLYQPFRENSVEEGGGEEEALLSTAEAEAWAIVRFIKDRVGGGSLKVRDRRDEDGKVRLRPAVYDDVAILMRSSSNQIHLEKYLRRLQIPYTVQSLRSLFQEAPVNDIYQMLQLLVYPRDLTAYAALLRSPFVHLSDDLAGRIVLETRDRGGGAFSHSGEEAFFQDPMEKEKYLHACRLYRELREKAVDQPIAELVRYLWYEGGYRYVVLRDPDYHLYLEFYDALIALARLSDSRGEGLSLFLDFLRDNLGDYKKLEELELIPRSGLGVQLLSIHKSKGLEFPVVILADTGNTGGGGRTKLYAWDEHFGPVFNLSIKNGKSRKGKRNYFSDITEARRKREEAAELKRLLYVGCTRAKDHLVLAGSHHSKNRKIDSEDGQKALLNLVLEAFGWDGKSPVSEMTLPMGCEICEIPETTVDEVRRRSSGSRSRSLSEVRALMEAAPRIVRDFPRREWNATELNQFYLQMKENEMSGAEQNAEESRARGQRGAEETTWDARNGDFRPPTGRRNPEDDPRERFEAASGGMTQADLLPVLEEIDPLLRGNREAMAFGELVHGLIEREIKGLPGDLSLPGVFLELENKTIELLTKAARSVAEGFFSTPLGKEVMAAARTGRVESELPFLLRVGGSPPGDFFSEDGFFPDKDGSAGDDHSAVGTGSRPKELSRREQHLVRGQIDLLLQREEEVVAVDFKTDRSARPEDYAVQMALYRKAAEGLYGKPARSVLVYVRSGELREVDTEVDMEGLVDRAMEELGHVAGAASPGVRKGNERKNMEKKRK